VRKSEFSVKRNLFEKIRYQLWSSAIEHKISQLDKKDGFTITEDAAIL